MSITDDEIDMPEDKATCPICFHLHAPVDCPVLEEEESAMKEAQDEE